MDPIRAENALHGERIVATARLALMLLRTLTMATWAVLSTDAPPAGAHRIVGVPLYTFFCIAVFFALRRPRARVTPWMPHLLNLVDYGFVVLMAKASGATDPAGQREMTALGLALVLSFSVAREGTTQAALSTAMACTGYLVALQWGDRGAPIAIVFVLASFVAFSFLALRVVVRLQRRATQATRLGQYTLLERIGEGGMGEIYKATHAMLRRPTAVKLLKGQSPESLVRFEREVQLTARLAHPNTIAIFDYGRTPDGVFYYAMEYLDGLTFEQLVELHGPQEPARVVHLLRQACGSLAEAHGSGLIHRDVKPANLLLCERGGVSDFVKVLDFGLVKDTALAQTNDQTIAGTPLFLAPEAIAAPEKVDARSDLYGLGCIAYYLVAGKHVFEGSTLVELCSHHLHTKPERPSRKRGSDVPRDLEDVILACLAKDPKDRPQSAQDLAARLASCGCADEWDDVAARAWWQTNRQSLAKLSVSRSVASGERSLAVDLAR